MSEDHVPPENEQIFVTFKFKNLSYFTSRSYRAISLIIQSQNLCELFTAKFNMILYSNTLYTFYHLSVISLIKLNFDVEINHDILHVCFKMKIHVILIPIIALRSKNNVNPYRQMFKFLGSLESADISNISI